MIGLFGGSFDPIHDGHLHFARQAQRILSLDKVIFIPAAQNPLKGPGHASASQRLEMLQRALAECGESGFAIYDGEIKRPPPSYTIDTIEELLSQAREHGESDPRFTWLMGREVFESLPRWKAPEKILQKVELTLIHRPGSPAPDIQRILSQLPPVPTPRVRVIEISPLPFSATEIRERLVALSPRERQSTEPPVPGLRRAVWLFIKENQLYTVR